MSRQARPRDPAILDALEAIEPFSFSGPVWRVARKGRDPLDCSRSGGRWDDGSFDVLYTAMERDGAIAEMYFHLRRGQPIMPSQVTYHVHELTAKLEGALRLADLDALAALGMNAGSFGRLSYEERAVEYPKSQDIGEAAHFLGFDGLVVPSARWQSPNVVLFCEQVPPDSRLHSRDLGQIDWTAWAAANAKSR